MSSKKLPVLKLMLLPPAAFLFYSAYCYYSEQYELNQEKQYAPIKDMRTLQEAVENASTPKQLQKAYVNMNKHVEMQISDPSRRKLFVTNNSESFWYSRFKISKELNLNYFNKEAQIKEGTFSFGYWLNVIETVLLQIRDINTFQTVLSKSIGVREKKCSEIAEKYSGSAVRGFTETYQTCVAITNEEVAGLRRKLDLMSKVKKYQIIF